MTDNQPTQTRDAKTLLADFVRPFLVAGNEVPQSKAEAVALAAAALVIREGLDNILAELKQEANHDD